MTKPTTYYVQTPEIDDLSRCFGSQLEELTREDKLGLRMLLGTYLYLKEVEEEWTLDAVVTETPLHEPSEELEEVIDILETIPPDAAEGLIEALTAQLRHGNARRGGH
ncbi:hypothetical protein NDA01_25965 [Trichocoleus desertorum AS-A10]|uniref:hypothetical protein n=1 Tax=Trichocoleus desertorum TaxID=1481672 RepID=UPI00329A6D74